jgi:DUF3047 family protein
MAGRIAEAALRCGSMNIPSDFAALETQWQTAAAGSGLHLSRHTIVFLPAEQGGWVDTGLQVAKGQVITLLADGQVWLSREADLSFGANITLWYRIEGEDIARSPGSSVTFASNCEGKLSLVVKPPGEWANRSGDFLPDYPHGGCSGGLLVAVLIWNSTAEAGLTSFAALDASGIAGRELARIAKEAPLPKGWEPLWRVGATGMFRESADVISCECCNDAAILKYPMDVELTPTTQLSWSWRVSRLPSRIPENTLAGHDYVSVAVEFDNGQDLTWFWSVGLPVGTTFRCPIPWWDRHETHVVARSGTSELGVWKSESKHVLAGYRDSVGGELPRRIVGIWLISLSPFQRGVAAWECRDIELHSS